MANILQKWLGMQNGGPSMEEAIALIRDRSMRERQEKAMGSSPLSSPMKTAYGTVDSTGLLNEDFQRAQMERQAGIDQTEAAKQAEILKQQADASMPSSVNSPMYGQDLGVGFGGPGQNVPAPVQPEVKGIVDQYEQNNLVDPSVDTSGFGQLARDWYASKGHADQGDKAAMIASKAAEYGVDPYMALALSAQEGGWSRYHPEDSKNNYFGWGVTDSGDMGLGGDSLEGWLNQYMPDIAKQYGGRDKITDWGGSLQGLGQGSDYGARYNYNDSWVKALSSLINDANSYGSKNYPDLPRTSIDTSY